MITSHQIFVTIPENFKESINETQITVDNIKAIEKDFRSILLYAHLIRQMDEEIEYTLDDYASACVYLNVLVIEYPIVNFGNNDYSNEKFRDYMKIFYKNGLPIFTLLLIRNCNNEIFGYRIYENKTDFSGGMMCKYTDFINNDYPKKEGKDNGEQS